jgi:DNA invertase Pin-like site-specific DNA recombinase
MDTHAPSDSKTPDTDARIDTKTPTANHPNDTGTPGALTPADSTNGPSKPPRSFALKTEAHGDDLADVVAAVTTIAQSWCEHATDYTDIETLVCQLPIDQWTFAAQDAFTPYSGPYPMALLVRAFLIEEINGWDDTALHDHLYANPSLHRGLSFETLPNQSTFWRAWNHRFCDELCAAVQECADAIVRAARTCRVSLPERITAAAANEPQADDRPEHQLIAEKTDEVWQQAKPFVCDAFALDRGQNWQIHANAFWEQHAYMGMREDMYAASGPASFYLDTTRERVPSGSTHRYQIGKLSVPEIRSMLRNTTRMLIARARQHGELTGKLWAAIDVTKGVPFTGDVDDDDDDIPGYKDGNKYYQWAVLKIVGMDVPLVLDAIPRKRQDVEDYAAANEYSLAEIYNEGKRASGFDADRPEYQALRDHITTGAVDVVLVPNLSRLSRDRKERLRLLLDVDAADVTVHSVELGRAVDLDDDWALVQQSIRATTDDVEKRKEIERSKRATQERLENGYDHGRPPFGLVYDEHGTYWVPDRDSEEFPIALTCIELRESGRSWREIAKETDVSKDTARRIYDRRERYTARETTEQ